jgi:site-specific DNA-methyltransferase (adenine-specific)
MKPYSIHHGKLAEVAPSLDGKFHAALCDPPYGLEFMGKEWDRLDVRQPGDATFHKSGVGPFDRAKVRHSSAPSYGGSAGAAIQAWYHEQAVAMLSVLHPGALALCFGGTRTWHRLACGFEDAGFQPWDTLMWLHGQGFPKAQDISKLIDKANGNARGNIVGTSSGPNNSRYEGQRYAETRQTKFGAVQDQPVKTAPGSEASAPWVGHKTCALKPAWEPVLCFRAPSQGKSYAELAQMFGSGALYVDGGRIAGPQGDGVWGSSNATCKPSFNDSPEQHEFKSTAHDAGRYPANVALDEESAAILDGQSGELSSGGYPPEGTRRDSQGILGQYPPCGKPKFTHSTGGASRFFYTSKADSSERHSFNEVTPSTRNHHPTVKPIDLCRWLATLLLPPKSAKPRRLLVPFSGSGSEIIGALQAGWDEVVGIDQDAEYCKLVPARIEHHVGLFAQSEATQGDRELSI